MNITKKIPSPRITPTNSISNVEWDNITSYNRKTISRYSSKKIKYNCVAISCGLTIAILIVIAILVPLMSTSKSTTTSGAISASSVTTITSILVTPTNAITNTLSTTTTPSIATSTSSETTTITQSTRISTTSESTTTITTPESTTTIQSTTTLTSSQTTTTTTTITTTSETTTTTESTHTSTTSESTTTTTTFETTTTTQSTTTITTSETTTTTQSTTTITTSTTTSTTQSTTTSTTSQTTTTTGSTSTSTTSETTTTSESTTTTTTSLTSTTTTMATLQWNTTGLTVAGQTSLYSVSANNLYLPIGIWIDSSDILYVADASNNRVQKFISGNITGTTVAGNRGGLVGSNASFLNYSNDMAVDSSGNIFVVDSYNNRVQLWNVNATSGITIAGTGIAGNSTTQLDSPRAIAFGSNTSIFYISDSNNNRVMRYTLNSTVGTLVAGGNGLGNNITQLSNPRGLYFDASTNSLYIANAGANNVVQWVIGASNWTLVAGNISGVAGNGSSYLYGPWDVTLDSAKNVYVADRYNERVQFFLAGQTNGITIAGATDAIGTSAVKLSEPLSVALDSQLNLIVSDSFNYRIQKFLRY